MSHKYTAIVGYDIPWEARLSYTSPHVLPKLICEKAIDQFSNGDVENVYYGPDSSNSPVYVRELYQDGKLIAVPQQHRRGFEAMSYLNDAAKKVLSARSPEEKEAAIKELALYVIDEE